MRLRYLTSAYHDLQLIFEYIARENPVAARRIITALQKKHRPSPNTRISADLVKLKEHVSKCMGAIRISSPTVSKTTKYRYSASFTAHANGRKIFKGGIYADCVSYKL